MIYPDDKLYLRLGLLLNDILKCLDGDIKAYAYVNTIKKQIGPNTDIDKIKKTERFLISPAFLCQTVFTSENIYPYSADKIKAIIRNYKLRMIL